MDNIVNKRRIKRIKTNLLHQKEEKIKDYDTAIHNFEEEKKRISKKLEELETKNLNLNRFIDLLFVICAYISCVLSLLGITIFASITLVASVCTKLLEFSKSYHFIDKMNTIKGVINQCDESINNLNYKKDVLINSKSFNFLDSFFDIEKEAIILAYMMAFADILMKTNLTNINKNIKEAEKEMKKHQIKIF